MSTAVCRFLIFNLCWVVFVEGRPLVGPRTLAYTCIHPHGSAKAKNRYLKGSHEGGYKGGNGTPHAQIEKCKCFGGAVVERRVRCRPQKSSSRDKISGNPLSTGRRGRGGARTHQFSQRGVVERVVLKHGGGVAVGSWIRETICCGSLPGHLQDSQCGLQRTGWDDQ